MSRSVRTIIGVLLLNFLSSSSAHAEGAQRIWVDAGRSILDSSYYFQAKYMNGSKGWALRGTKEVQDTIFTAVFDEVLGREFDPSYNTLGIMRVWGYPLSFGYADIGIGLGYAKGDRAQDCGSIPGLVTVVQEIPVQASFALGRYVGLGASVSGFYSPENSRAMLSIVLAFGTFSSHAASPISIDSNFRGQ